MASKSCMETYGMIPVYCRTVSLIQMFKLNSPFNLNYRGREILFCFGILLLVLLNIQVKHKTINLFEEKCFHSSKHKKFT